MSRKILGQKDTFIVTNACVYVFYIFNTHFFCEYATRIATACVFYKHGK